MTKCAFTLAVLVSLAGFGCGSTSSLGDAQVEPSFVAVGAEGSIVSSRDGMGWTAEFSGVSVRLSSVAAGPSAFVAVGAGGTLLTSVDAASWIERDSRTEVDLVHVIFEDGKFIAVGGSWSSGAVTLASSDGATWETIDSPASYMFHAVARGGGTLVAAAYFRSDLQTPALFTSAITSGSSAGGWSQRQGPNFYDSVTVAGEISVVGGTSVSSSRDGISWTTRQLPGNASAEAIASSGSTWVIVGERGAILGAEDCGAEKCWSERPSTLGTRNLYGVTHGNSRFVAVGAGGVIATSPDSWTWETAASGTTQDLSDVAFGPVGQ